MQKQQERNQIFIYGLNKLTLAITRIRFSIKKQTLD